MDGLIEFLRHNIMHVAPILAMGAFALVVSLERVRALYFVFPMTGSAHFYERIRDFVLSNRVGEAIALCERFPSKPVANIVKEGLLQASQPETLVEDALQIAAADAIQKVQQRTPFLATIANVATLMGLFGTILGLVQSFEAIGSASAQQRSALLASGISTAMNATMMGLGVAIPCMVIFAFLAAKSNKLSSEIQQAGMKTLKIIKQRYYSTEQSAPGTGSFSSPIAKGM